MASRLSSGDTSSQVGAIPGRTRLVVDGAIKPRVQPRIQPSVDDKSPSDVVYCWQVRDAFLSQMERCLVPAKRKYVGWSLWLWWVLASSIGGLLGLAGGFAVGFAIDGAVSGIASQSVFGGIIGASIGALQWVVLRQQLSRAAWWVVATTLGTGLGFALVSAASSLVSGIVGGGPSYGLVNGGLVGTLVGTLQWVVLRQHVSRAGGWVLASALGTGVGFALGQAVGQLVGVALTGIALVWILRQPAQEE